MMEHAKITATHRQRLAIVYIRQSSPTQLERNRESTLRQYQFVARAVALGWAKPQVQVIDEDLGVSANGLADRPGFAHLTAEVALGHVGIVLGLELSRLSRNNADWYRLLDLCGLTGTVLADEEGISDPSAFNDRLLLGLKGTMSEAELHILRARLDGGIRNKAARGELRRGLPVGLVWGEDDGEVRLDPDEAVTAAIRTVFDRFSEVGSVRRVWLWFRSEGLLCPFRRHAGEPIQWITPTYLTIHQVLTNPVYAGAYTSGKTRQERYLDATGQVRQRSRHLPRSEWASSFRTIIRATSPGRPTSPTRSGSVPTPVHASTRRVARCARERPCSRDSPSAAAADVGCACPTTVATSRLAPTARPACWSTGEAVAACAWVASSSMWPWPPRS